MIKDCVRRKAQLGHQALGSANRLAGCTLTLPLACYLAGKSQQGMIGLETIIWESNIQLTGGCVPKVRFVQAAAKAAQAPLPKPKGLNLSRAGGEVALGHLPWFSLREEPWGYSQGSSHTPHGKFLPKKKSYIWEGHGVDGAHSTELSCFILFLSVKDLCVYYLYLCAHIFTCTHLYL